MSALEVGTDVHLLEPFTVEDTTVTPEDVGTIEDIACDGRLYVVFHECEYTDMFGGGTVTVSNVFDLEAVEAA